MSSSPYLIVGNSVAAMAGIQGIREQDAEGPITLVAKEPYHTYSRPLITYLLGGMVDEEGLLYRPLDYYDRSGVRALLGHEVTGLDSEGRAVETAGGKRLSFEKLLIAVGGRPIVPAEVPGTELEGVFTFTTLDDARNLKAYLDEHEVAEALIVGGGLIGLKCVEALVELGVRATVVELADRLLSATLDETGSELMRGRLREAGVEVLCENTVTGVEGSGGKVTGAMLQDGTEVACQLVIFAIGVVPNTSLVEGTGIAVDRGILVDNSMMTSAEGIYAAGDVAQAEELLCGERRCIPIFPNAYRQGLIAGCNMAGGERAWEGGLAMNCVAVCEVPTISVGRTGDLDDRHEVLSSLDERNLTYKKIVLEDDVIVGAIFVGQIDRAGIITGLIRQRVEVSGFKDMLMTDDFGLISLPSDYRKHVVSGLGIEV